MFLKFIYSFCFKTNFVKNDFVITKLIPCILFLLKHSTSIFVTGHSKSVKYKVNVKIDISSTISFYSLLNCPVTNSKTILQNLL